MDDFKSLIGKVATGATLSRDESAKAFDHMMSGEATPSQMGGLGWGCAARETVVRSRSGDHDPPRAEGAALRRIDVVGTAASIGLLQHSPVRRIVEGPHSVAKHGKPRASSRSGAAA